MTVCNLCQEPMGKVKGWSWRILCDRCEVGFDPALIEATYTISQAMTAYRRRHMGERPPEQMQLALNKAYGRLRHAIRQKHAGPP